MVHPSQSPSSSSQPTLSSQPSSSSVPDQSSATRIYTSFLKTVGLKPSVTGLLVTISILVAIVGVVCGGLYCIVRKSKCKTCAKGSSDDETILEDNGGDWILDQVDDMVGDKVDDMIDTVDDVIDKVDDMISYLVGDEEQGSCSSASAPDTDNARKGASSNRMGVSVMSSSPPRPRQKEMLATSTAAAAAASSKMNVQISPTTSSPPVKRKGTSAAKRINKKDKKKRKQRNKMKKLGKSKSDKKKQKRKQVAPKQEAPSAAQTVQCAVTEAWGEAMTGFLTFGTQTKEFTENTSKQIGNSASNAVTAIGETGNGKSILIL